MNEDETNDETDADADGHGRTRTDTDGHHEAPVDLTAPLQVKNLVINFISAKYNIDIGNIPLKDSSEKDKRFMPFDSLKSETLNEERAGQIRCV